MSSAGGTGAASTSLPGRSGTASGGSFTHRQILTILAGLILVLFLRELPLRTMSGLQAQHAAEAAPATPVAAAGS